MIARVPLRRLWSGHLKTIWSFLLSGTATNSRDRNAILHPFLIRPSETVQPTGCPSRQVATRAEGGPGGRRRGEEPGQLGAHGGRLEPALGVVDETQERRQR